MSTKTTFKRIALVAVATLGLGMLTSAPSQASDSSTTVSTFTSSLSLAHTSATVVGYDNSNPLRSAAIFKMTAIGNNGQSSALFNTSGGETITALVTGLPAISAVNATPSINDLIITPVKVSGSNYVTAASGATTGAASTATISSATASVGSPDSARVAAGTVGTNPNSVYYFAVTPNDAGGYTGKAVDAGVYTVRIRLTDNTGFSTSYNVSVNFVASAADSGAIITPTITGRYVQGDNSLTWTSTRRMSATVTNSANGRLFAAGSADYTPAAPVLSAALTTSAGVVRSESLAIADTGASTTDRVAIASPNTYTGASGSVIVSAADRDAADALNRAIDGTYGISSSSAFGAPTATGDLLRVRYGSTSATTALTIVPAATSGTTGTATFTATGGVLGTNAITLPLSTTSVTFTNTVTTGSGSTLAPVTGYDVYYTLSYEYCLAADQTPVATTAPVKVVTDSSGKASVTVTSLKTKDTCSAIVTWSGAAVNPAAQTATWQLPVANRSVVSTGSYEALTKTAHTITWTVTDQFGAPFAGEVVTFTASGANIPTVGLASKLTDSNGQVSFTWTDAAGVPASTTLGTTSIRLNTVGGAAPTTSNAAAVVVTYKTALSTVSSLRATYTDSASQVLIPTTDIGGATGIAIGAADQLDTTKVLAGAATAPWVELTFTARDSAQAAVTGVPTTVTVTGAKLIGSDGKLADSIVVYSNNAVRVLGTTTGVATVTATNGTLTSKATINFVNAATDARVLKLVESNGLITATVTDAFGNGVKDITVNVVGTGAWFGNGATSASFITAADGSVTFQATSAGTVTASITATGNKTDYLAGFGNATGTVVTPGAPAGVRTASVTTKGAADPAKVAADAATAAADAATAAAKAAEAAAVAAVEKAAADAVAAAKAAGEAAVAAAKAGQDAAVAAAEKAAKDAVAAAKAGQDAAVAAAEAATDAAAEAIDAANAATDAANLSAEAADAATVAAEEARDAADAATAAVEELATQVAALMAALKAQITTLANTVAKIAKKVKA